MLKNLIVIFFLHSQCRHLEALERHAQLPTHYFDRLNMTPAFDVFLKDVLKSKQFLNFKLITFST